MFVFIFNERVYRSPKRFSLDCTKGCRFLHNPSDHRILKFRFSILSGFFRKAFKRANIIARWSLLGWSNIQGCIQFCVSLLQVIRERIRTRYCRHIVRFFCTKLTPSFANKFTVSTYAASRIDLPKVSPILRLLLVASMLEETFRWNLRQCKLSRSGRVL